MKLAKTLYVGVKNECDQLQAASRLFFYSP
jgi:hypothetical protein